ncbi:MAG: DUF2628 domain-containing protein [Acetobacteraceae bacterium]
MRFFTVHTRADQAPVLLVEGFRWGAFLFGPLWLLRYRAVIPAALDAAALVAIIVLASGILLAVLLLAAVLLIGLNANDLRRWSLERRGFLFSDVIAANDSDEALARLLARRPAEVTRLA